MRKGRAARAVAIVIVFTALGKLLGFIREMAMAAHFGAGAATDAYLTAALAITLLFNILGGRSPGTVFIPVYHRISAAGGAERAARFTGTVLALACAVSTLTALLGFALAPQLVGGLAPGLPPHTREAAIHCARLLTAGIPLLTASGLLASLLNAHNNFTVPAALGIPLNLMVTGFIFFTGAGDLDALVFGTLTGYLAQVMVTLIALVGMRIKIFAGIDRREPGLARVGGLLLPVIAGGFITQLNPLVNRVLASGLPEGSISALAYADRIIQLPLGLLVTAVITVSYPALSGAAALEGRGSAVEAANRWAGALLFVTVPTALVLAALSRPLARTVFERGAFDGDATAATACALLFYSLGLPFIAWSRFLTRLFYIYHDSGTPVLIGAATALANILLCLVLVKPMGYRGLALASSISAAAGIPLFLICLRAKTGCVFNRAMKIKLLSITTAAAAAAFTMLAASAAAGGTEKNGLWGNLLYLLLVGGVGMVSYFSVARFLKLEEAEMITVMLKRIKFFPGRRSTW